MEKCTGQTPARIQSNAQNLDGSNIEDILTGLRTPTGIAVDPEEGKVYWADSSYR